MELYGIVSHVVIYTGSDITFLASLAFKGPQDKKKSVDSVTIVVSNTKRKFRISSELHMHLILTSCATRIIWISLLLHI